MFKQKSLHILLGGALCLAASTISAQIAVKSGDKIVFMGDTVTRMGNGRAGFLNLVMSALEANGVKAVKIPAGGSGHKSNQMLERTERDVIRNAPQIMVLSCGMCDVQHGKRGVSLEDYKKNMTQIVDRVLAAGIKVYILTATMITENPNHPDNQKLAAYNDFLRTLAKEKSCTLVDVNAGMQKQLADIRTKYPDIKGNLLTQNGIVMNPLGNIMMAEGILRAFGMTEEQLAKAQPAWNKMSLPQDVYMSLGEYKALSEKAFQAKQSVPDYLKSMVKKELQ